MIYLSLNYPYLSIDGVNFAEALLLKYDTTNKLLWKVWTQESLRK